MKTHRPRLSRRTALGLLGGSLLLPRAAMAARVETLSGTAFGTQWRVAARPDGGLHRLAPEVEALFAGIDRQLSPWRPDSAISRFNAAPAGAFAADRALTEVASAALRIAGQSDGAFDPTVGPLVARWGFGPIVRGGEPDWRALAARPSGVTKARADLTLDLCGIAKGWALDQAAARLLSAGIEDLLFDLGGEFVALGRHPDGREWRVAVESPLQGRPSAATLSLPSGTAVATSDTREQSYVMNGRRYSHIIDPGTRTPTAGTLLSVTVVAADAMTADAWATALCAAGDEDGPALAEAHGIAALFVSEDAGRLRLRRSGAIAEMLL